MTKKKAEKVDGLSSKDIAKIRSAVRQIWHRSHPRKLVVQRSTGADGFPVCEQCGSVVPKVHIDHIVTVGDVDAGFLERLFCPSSGLQALCRDCHNEKTKEERRNKREKSSSKKIVRHE